MLEMRGLLFSYSFWETDNTKILEFKLCWPKLFLYIFNNKHYKYITFLYGLEKPVKQDLDRHGTVNLSIKNHTKQMVVQRWANSWCAGLTG